MYLIKRCLMKDVQHVVKDYQIRPKSVELQ